MKVPFDLTEESLMQALNGEIQIYRMDKRLRTKLTKEARISFDIAIKKGYVTGAHGSPLFWGFQEWCKLRKLPYVHVYPKLVYSEVQMDLIFTPYTLDDTGKTEVERMFLQYPGRYFGPGVFTIHRRIPHSDSEGVAQELLRVYQTHRKTEERQ